MLGIGKLQSLLKDNFSKDMKQWSQNHYFKKIMKSNEFFLYSKQRNALILIVKKNNYFVMMAEQCAFVVEVFSKSGDSCVAVKSPNS